MPNQQFVVPDALAARMSPDDLTIFEEVMQQIQAERANFSSNGPMVDLGTMLAWVESVGKSNQPDMNPKRFVEFLADRLVGVLKQWSNGDESGVPARELATVIYQASEIGGARIGLVLQHYPAIRSV